MLANQIQGQKAATSKKRRARSKSVRRLGPTLSPFQERLKETDFYTKPIIDKFDSLPTIKVRVLVIDKVGLQWVWECLTSCYLMLGQTGQIKINIFMTHIAHKQDVTSILGLGLVSIMKLGTTGDSSKLFCRKNCNSYSGLSQRTSLTSPGPGLSSSRIRTPGM